jgi:hypothetical protein
MSHQRFQTQTNSFGVGAGAASRLGLIEQRLVDMERLFHMYDYAIFVWQKAMG